MHQYKLQFESSPSNLGSNVYKDNETETKHRAAATAGYISDLNYVLLAVFEL
jgi:hypothetical protein